MLAGDTIQPRAAVEAVARLVPSFPLVPGVSIHCQTSGRGAIGPALAHATVRAAVEAAARLAPSLPLVAGGRSFGGRMTSQAQAEAPLPGVRGLVFLGFPLHPASKPSDDRAKHLSELCIPMLFLQGTRDTLAVMQLLAPLVEQLGDTATLAPVQDADHSFHVPVRSGRTDMQVLGEMLDTLAAWIRSQALGRWALCAGPGGSSR